MTAEKQWSDQSVQPQQCMLSGVGVVVNFQSPPMGNVGNLLGFFGGIILKFVFMLVK